MDPKEQFEALITQQEEGRGDNPAIDPPDVAEVDNGDSK